MRTDLRWWIWGLFFTQAKIPFDANKLYCSEILAILLQNNDSKCASLKGSWDFSFYFRHLNLTWNHMHCFMFSHCVRFSFPSLPLLHPSSRLTSSLPLPFVFPLPHLKPCEASGSHRAISSVLTNDTSQMWECHFILILFRLHSSTCCPSTTK